VPESTFGGVQVADTVWETISILIES